jgi:hypothetical protein
VGLNRFAVDGKGTALAIRAAGTTSSDKVRSESAETRLITRWSGRKRNSERTSRAAEGLTAITIVSEWSRTSWLRDATDIPGKRLASPLAIAELRGDNQMEWAVTLDELRPVTIDDVISPVPMNPSCMSSSCRFYAEARKDLERALKKAQTVFVSILSDERRGHTRRGVVGPQVTSRLTSIRWNGRRPCARTLIVAPLGKLGSSTRLADCTFREGRAESAARGALRAALACPAGENRIRQERQKDVPVTAQFFARRSSRRPSNLRPSGKDGEVVSQIRAASRAASAKHSRRIRRARLVFDAIL